MLKLIISLLKLINFSGKPFYSVTRSLIRNNAAILRAKGILNKRSSSALQLLIYTNLLQKR